MNEHLVDKATAKRLKLAKSFVSARFQLLVWVAFGTCVCYILCVCYVCAVCLKAKILVHAGDRAVNKKNAVTGFPWKRCRKAQNKDSTLIQRCEEGGTRADSRSTSRPILSSKCRNPLRISYIDCKTDIYMYHICSSFMD
jgi:hypothetical protein